MEQRMAALCGWVRQHKGQNIQQILKTLEESELPEEHRQCFRFFQSLSGPSRNLFIDVAHGRKLNKLFAPGRARTFIKPFNTLAYTPGKKDAN
jgi:hypothetical protein